MESEAIAVQRLGPYVITGVLGEGGMGTVYEAVREDQYRQKVAIKLVRRDLDTAAVRRRLQRERQILASLDHPNIARLLDGGTTADGVPYLVMEFVPGKTILEYAQSLGLEERLKLFRHVCDGVSYAHQKLVVHRDLKPSNIQVGLDGAPRLLDFGIAKLMDPDLDDGAITATIAPWMSPDYTSPEQVRGEPAMPSNDIYSLGAILFELLTHSRPHQFSTYSPAEIVREVCEREVPKASEVAPAKLARKLKGDLDTILLTAMHKDPSRRYASVDALSEDIRRYLDGRPIGARKDTLSYRAGKFLARNRAASAIAALCTIGLIAGAASAIVEGRRADRRFTELRSFARSVVFELHDSIQNLPGATAARALLVKRASQYLDALSKDAGSDPGINRELAQAYERLGSVQGNPAIANTGEKEAASASLRKALAIYEKLNDLEGQRGAARVEGNLSLVEFSRGSLDEAMKWARRSLDTEQKIATDAVGLANAHGSVAYILLQKGDLKGALPEAMQEAAGLEAQAKAHPDDRSIQRAVAVAYRRLGQIQGRLRMAPEGTASFERALTIDEKLIGLQPDNAVTQGDLAIDYQDLARVKMHRGDLEGGVAFYRKTMALQEKLAAADPTNTRAQNSLLITSTLLAQTLSRQHKGMEAAPIARRAVEIAEGLNQRGFSRQAQAGLASALIALGDAHVAGANGGKPAARAAYDRAQELFLDLRSRSQLSIDDAQDLADVQRKLARL